MNGLKTNRFDAIIVGGGPAGLWCARKLAEKNISCLVLDKKQEIGVPVRCGEGLGLGWFKRLGLKPSNAWCAKAMTGAVLFAPSGKEIVLDFKKTSGDIIERRMFEKFLAREAAGKGALIRVKTRVTDVIKETGKVIGVKVNDMGEETEYYADVVVAADGVESKVARYAGLNTTNNLYHIDSGFEYEMAGIDIPYPSLIHLYFGTKISPRGYVWIFPKGKNEANVGIGILGSDPRTAKSYLDEWIAGQPNLAKGSIIHVNSGGIPVGGFLEKMTQDNFMVIGDAAHQVNPIHGGGMGLAMEAAEIAAEVIAKAKKKNDFSDKVLSEYTETWYEKRGNELKKILLRRKMFEQLTDSDFETIAGSFSSNDVMELVYGSPVKAIAVIGKKLVTKPKLAALLVKYLAMKVE